MAALKLWAGQSALAYQLQDDLEDLQIESEKGQGRGVGSDLLRCKPTYLYALAKTRAGRRPASLAALAGGREGRARYRRHHRHPAALRRARGLPQ
ncbi:polyprenyl synthetase family protein [Massilia sp. B-10]|nr:polyprenyl synthetase family protein [Massilia sp. B-10]